MIPKALTVEGFLCYRAAQTISFDGAALWMLAGPNGSGKSTIFDAMTFALFGYHRGGQQKAKELINKSCSRLLVEFDFLLDGQLYQVRRTLRRKASPASTWQVRCWHTDLERAAGWQEVPDTSSEEGFDRWVYHHVGLTYETFTSSVLLLQGRSENLLTSVPAKRFEVLAGIVGLDRYQMLHERADARRKELLSEARVLQTQLQGLRGISDEEWAAATDHIKAAESAHAEAQEEAARLQGLQIQAQRWSDLQTDLHKIEQELASARALAADADSIQRDWARLGELRQLLPLLSEMVVQRQRLQQATRLRERLAALKESLQGRALELEHAIEQARIKRSALHCAVAADEGREQLLATRLRELSGLVARIEVYEKQRQTVAHLEMEFASLPRDPDRMVARAHAACQRLTALAQVLPRLVQLDTQRSELRLALQRVQTESSEESAAAKAAEQLAARMEALSQQRAQAQQSRGLADQGAWQVRTLLGERQRHLQELEDVSGSQTCRHCGQALTPGHIEEERTRRRKELAAAEAASRQADLLRTQAAQAEQLLFDQENDVARRLAQEQDEARQCGYRRQQAEYEVRQRTDLCRRAYEELPPVFQCRVSQASPADWLETVYPAEEDLADARRQLEGMEACRQRLQKAQAIRDHWQGLQGRLAAGREMLTAQEVALPAHPNALRQEHAELITEEQDLHQRLVKQRLLRDEVDRQLDELERDRDHLRQQVADHERQSGEQEILCQVCQESLVRARHGLPTAWQLLAESSRLEGDLQDWITEMGVLEKKGTPGRFQQLQQVQGLLEALQQNQHKVQLEQEQLPAEAQQCPVHIGDRFEKARRAQLVCEERLQQARQEQALLAMLRQQRRNLSEETLATEKQHKLYDRLANLLGRDRLQLHLVRQAERGIVEYANAVLGRLSGGQLYLRLASDQKGDGGMDKALQLEAINQNAGPEPIRVEFLSGSQRFRVAVSLALGIGQYASRQHRPIESVIIDEGFGCLDKSNRQMMIQELQNLQGQLRCILVVSHQEEFAAAFNDAYYFDLVNGTTEVVRVQG